MNKLSKKLLLCALLAGNILTTASVKCKAVTEEEETDYSGVSELYEAEEKRASRAAAKKAAEEETDYSGVAELYEEEEKEEAKTKPVGKKGKRRKRRAKGKATRAEKGSRFAKRKKTRRTKAKSARAKTRQKKTRPVRKPKGVSQTARHKGRVKPWQRKHKEVQSKRRSGRKPMSASARLARIKKRAHALYRKHKNSDWNAQDYRRARILQRILNKRLPRPHTEEDALLLSDLQEGIDRYEGLKK